MNILKKLAVLLLTTVTLTACSEEKEPTVVYLDSKTGQEVAPPAPVEPVEMMEHWSSPEIRCIAGYQAYKVGYNNGNAYLWKMTGTGNLFSCDENTKADGSQL